MQDVPFIFEELDRVVIDVSGEECLVVGRAQFYDRENKYFLRYCDGQGRGTERWWGESALTLLESEDETGDDAPQTPPESPAEALPVDGAATPSGSESRPAWPFQPESGVE